jgi:two-component system, NtrC family, sensor kinase
MAAEGVKNEPRPSDAPSVPSTERVTITGGIPGEWLDRLLVALCQVHAEAPLDESVEALLYVAFELCEDAAFGVVVPRSALPGSLSEPGQIVIRVPATRASRPVEPDPARLFPELGFEQVIPFLFERGATLHAAADDPAYFSGGTAPARLLEHLARMLASLVDGKRAQDRSMRDLRAQVIQSEKLASLGQIAAGIVHELNNPLTTIVAYSDFLQRKLSGHGDPADVERLGRINEAAERILRFSRDLTAYSRPASELPAPVAIHDVIERALSFCEHELEKTGVLIERDFGEVRPVQGVPGQLTQVFVNLFTNAAHAMRQGGGLLSITTSMSETEVAVTVSDDGHGIDAGHRERIFEPFFTTKTDGSGTGLGLSIVRSILKSHGGRISVDGNVPRGTVFQVELPRAAAPVTMGAPPPNPRS